MGEEKTISQNIDQIANQIINQNNNQEAKPKFNFDRLKMYFGEPFTIKNKDSKDITVFQPTINDILIFGEKEFYSMLNVFVSNPTSYRLQLWDMGIDWNTISDYELFCMLIKTLDYRFTSLLFGDINFQSFILCPKENEGNSEIVLVNKEQDLEISVQTYNCIAEYLRLMFNIYPKVEKAKGKATKEAIIWEDRLNQKNNTNSDYNSFLLPLISGCINHAGFKYKLNELREVGIVQFMDSVQRLQIYENTVALMRGMYSGMIDIKGIDKEALNFMRNIEDSKK